MHECRTKLYQYWSITLTFVRHADTFGKNERFVTIHFEGLAHFVRVHETTKMCRIGELTFRRPSLNRDVTVKRPQGLQQCIVSRRIFSND